MALNTKSVAAPSWYTLEGQKDDDEPAQFLLEGLNGYQKSYIHGEVQVDVAIGSVKYSHRALFFLLSECVSGWRNINHDGKSIRFSDDMTVNMEILDINIQVELAHEILALSVITEEERKNSSLQSKSRGTGKTTTAKPAKKGTVTATGESSGSTQKEDPPAQ